MAKNTSTLLILFAAAFGLSSLTAGAVHGQGMGRRVFSSKSACEAATFLSREECLNAFDNALAELGEKSPRFLKRGECEQHFKRCMIAGFGARGSSVEFMPGLHGVEVSVRSAGDKTALPLLQVRHPAIELKPRTVLRRDVAQSNAVRARASERWATAQRAKETVGASPDSLLSPVEPVAEPPMARPEPGPVDPAKSARRKERIRNAPFVE